jgi:hypothetical protein
LLLLARLLIATAVLTALVAALVLLAALVRIVHVISYSVGMEVLTNVSQLCDVPGVLKFNVGAQHTELFEFLGLFGIHAQYLSTNERP